MKEQAGSAGNNIFLGIEGGGTRTVALAADASGRVLRRIEAGPA
jgi:N-acetylglucosamine kinase-like BadF-type ATPase